MCHGRNCCNGCGVKLMDVCVDTGINETFCSAAPLPLLAVHRTYTHQTKTFLTGSISPQCYYRNLLKVSMSSGHRLHIFSPLLQLLS